MPIRSVRGTGFDGLHPEYRRMTCPYTGQELLLVPALAPDVAILHAQYGDRKGNLRIEGPPVADVLFARASRLVIATVERLVSTEELRGLGGVTVPGFYVAGIAEVAFGAHPTACYPFYAYDRPNTAAYYAAAHAGPEEFERRYLAPFVRGCPNHGAYLERIGGAATRARLQSWTAGTDAWKRIYAEEAS
jgi:glutaconate CoA-transferase subunit A